MIFKFFSTKVCIAYFYSKLIYFGFVAKTIEIANKARTTVYNLTIAEYRILL